MSHIREVDAIVHVVRCFIDSNVTHVENSVNPARDVEIINLELILADIDTVTKAVDRAKTAAKGDKKYLLDVDVLTRLLNHLTDGKSARNFSASDEEKEVISNLFLLSAKPVIYAANISESDLGKNERDLPLVKEVEKSPRPKAVRFSLSAQKSKKNSPRCRPKNRKCSLPNTASPKAA